MMEILFQTIGWEKHYLFKTLDLYEKIDKDTFIEIEKIMDNAPTGEMDYLTWTQLPLRRNIAKDEMRDSMNISQNIVN